MTEFKYTITVQLGSEDCQSFDGIEKKIKEAALGEAKELCGMVFPWFENQWQATHKNHRHKGRKQAVFKTTFGEVECSRPRDKSNTFPVNQITGKINHMFGVGRLFTPRFALYGAWRIKMKLSVFLIVVLMTVVTAPLSYADREVKIIQKNTGYYIVFSDNRYIWVPNNGKNLGSSASNVASHAAIIARQLGPGGEQRVREALNAPNPMEALNRLSEEYLPKLQKSQSTELSDLAHSIKERIQQIPASETISDDLVEQARDYLRMRGLYVDDWPSYMQRIHESSAMKAQWPKFVDVLMNKKTDIPAGKDLIIDVILGNPKAWEKGEKVPLVEFHLGSIKQPGVEPLTHHQMGKVLQDIFGSERVIVEFAPGIKEGTFNVLDSENRRLISRSPKRTDGVISFKDMTPDTKTFEIKIIYTNYETNTTVGHKESSIDLSKPYAQTHRSTSHKPANKAECPLSTRLIRYFRK